ncbi:hypothetical protein FHS42_003518 [Streptomyces zagrosensis]|uniref:Uncharacterized protein n=1 Tax=Streptomyces zagrosensis TaxID=1042984 RepID=A0A7W9QA38_9ACTN|nr:hypothetical protein [Streptomyces zagrosensis]
MRALRHIGHPSTLKATGRIWDPPRQRAADDPLLSVRGAGRPVTFEHPRE